MTLTNNKMKELRALYQAASPDWEINPKSHLEVIQKGGDAIELRPLVFGAGTHIKSRHNAELAVAMFEALPDLLDAYEERDRLKNELEMAADSIGPLARLLEDNSLMARGVAKSLRLVEKSAYEALEPKQ